MIIFKMWRNFSWEYSEELIRICTILPFSFLTMINPSPPLLFSFIRLASNQKLYIRFPPWFLVSRMDCRQLSSTIIWSEGVKEDEVVKLFPQEYIKVCLESEIIFVSHLGSWYPESSQQDYQIYRDNDAFDLPTAILLLHHSCTQSL